ncbi:potassium channel family protein [Bacillus salitolerans]|uniref:Potassium channel family protein n=1 Tax=Bacillus salitolerans TaxID=1437434 RepID=A0ABW4LJ16_9BACI
MLFLFAVFFSVYKSFIQLFKRYERRGNHLSLENLGFLFLLYVNVLIGFGLIFTLIEMRGISVLIDNGVALSGSFFDIFSEAMYFSGVTLLSVGYGDITPIGIGRWFAIIEALIGYIIPAAFVVRSMGDYERAY